MRFRFARYLPIAFGWLVKRRIDLDAEDSYIYPAGVIDGVADDTKKFILGIDKADLNRAADRLGGFEKPALIAWSREDKLFKPAHAERLAEDLPNARVEWIDDARTFSMEDNPAQLAEADRGLRARAGSLCGVSDNGREAFVERFTRGWAGGRDTLAAAMEGHVADDVLLTQPLAPPARGLGGFHGQFKRLFRAIPDLTGEVHRWEPTEDGVTIDMTFHGTLAGRPFELPNRDRIVLRDGLLAERHADFARAAAGLALRPGASRAWCGRREGALERRNCVEPRRSSRTQGARSALDTGDRGRRAARGGSRS